MASSNNIPSVKFANGYSMPMFGLGTYLSQEGEVYQAVKDAINLGYRHIDTASFYGNEREIGMAIKEAIGVGTVKREHLFITTKLWNDCHNLDDVVRACKKSLHNLGLHYVDLYLIHWPFATKKGGNPLPIDANGKLIGSDVDYIETWRGMEDCVRQGLAHSIGISNFNSEQIERLLEAATIKPVNNQIEFNINVDQRRLIEFCTKRDITVTAYSPLGRPGNRRNVKSALEHPKIIAIAEKYKKTPAQVACRYVYQRGAAVIPKSCTKSRIKDNMEIFDFNLSDEDMEIITSVGTGERLVKFEEANNLKYYPFNIPF